MRGQEQLDSAVIASSIALDRRSLSPYSDLMRCNDTQTSSTLYLVSITKKHRNPCIPKFNCYSLGYEITQYVFPYAINH